LKSARIPIKVNNHNKNVYTIYNVPAIKFDEYDFLTNFYNFSGMTIDEYKGSINDDGSANISFNVYNSTCIYGVVEIRNSKDELIDCIIIDKKVELPTGIIDTVWDKGLVPLWIDALEGNTFNYRSQIYSQKTPVKIVNLPKGGYIRITNDSNQSAVCNVINAADILFSLYSAVSSGFKWDEFISKKFANEFIKVNKMDMFNAFADEIELSKIYKEAAKGIFKDNIALNNESISDFTEKIIVMLSNLNMWDIIGEAAKQTGISGAEDAFMALSGLPGIALKGMFTFTKFGNIMTEVNNWTGTYKNGSIIIQVPNDNSRTNTDVTVKCETFSDEEISLMVNFIDFISDVPEIFNNAKETLFYDINLLKGGEIVKLITDDIANVKISLPNKIGDVSLQDFLSNGGEISVYRMEDDDTFTKMESKINSYETIEFKTNHFSVYAVVFNEKSTKNNIFSKKNIVIGLCLITIIVLTIVIIFVVKKKRNKNISKGK